MVFKTAWHRFSSFYKSIIIIYDGHLEGISYLQTIPKNKTGKMFKISASHLVLKDNFTIMAQLFQKICSGWSPVVKEILDPFKLFM